MICILGGLLVVHELGQGNGRSDDEFTKYLGVEKVMAKRMRERGKLRTSPSSYIGSWMKVVSLMR